MESLATLDFSLGNYIVNCTGENCSDVKFLNLTDSEVQEYIVQKLGHRRKDLFSSFSLTCIYVVIFITGVVGNLSTCFVIRRNRYMHTTINLYLFSLAVADLLIIVLGFPNVLGCVDGTYIKIQGPSVNEPEYLNRKGYHSLNVQMICDAKLKITNCVAKWPGSVHDSRIFRDSHISVAFEDGQYNGLLLGDSGYPCKQYLMTPFPYPSTPSEEKFNKCHAKTRVLIEQTFGILKKRFACLHSGLRTTPAKGCDITLGCVVLHNIGIDRNDILDMDEVYVNHGDVNFNVRDEWDGRSVRQYVCQSFFT